MITNHSTTDAAASTPAAITETTRDRLGRILENLRASRERLDVPEIAWLTWDDLGDIDMMLGEAIREVKQIREEVSAQ